MMMFNGFPSTRCLTQDGTRLRTETAEAATRPVTETEVEETGIEDRLHTPPAVTESGTEEDGDTDRKEVMHVQGGEFVFIVRNIRFGMLKICHNATANSRWSFHCMWLPISFMLRWMPLLSVSVVAMTIGLQSTGHLIDDSARDIDAWIRAENVTVTEKGSHMEQLKVTIHATSPQTFMTTDVAVRGSGNGMSRTDGKAAGVSTNEGGVEPGPIAHPPRWVQPRLSLCFNSPHPPPPISVSSSQLFLSLSFSNHFFLTAPGIGK